MENNPIRLTDPDGMDPFEADNNVLFGNSLTYCNGCQTTRYANDANSSTVTNGDKDPPGTRKTAKADAAATASKVSKVKPKKKDPNELPTAVPESDVLKPYPDPHDVNNNDLGNPYTSVAAVGDVIPVTGLIMGGAELRATLLLKDVFTAEELTNMAFHSGVGADDAAVAAGQTILRNTNIGKALAEATFGMDMAPGSSAYKAWAELSEAWANSVPKGSNVNVYIKNPWEKGIYLNYEKPILQARGVIINEIPVKP